jgi:putative transposase
VIEAEKATYPIVWMCRLLGVPRSSFYAWRVQVSAETATAARRRQLGEHVARVFVAGRGAYGCRRVAAALNREGHRCSVGLVADLMREQGVVAVQPRAYKRTTVAGEHPVASPDLIERDFSAGGVPGTRLVEDINLPTHQRGLAVSGHRHRPGHPHGHRLADHRPPVYVTGHRRAGRRHRQRARRAGSDLPRRPRLPGQYTSTEFALFCKDNRVRTSLGRTGACWDNAAAESFFAALKNECYHHQHIPTRARASFTVAEYIEVFYNRQRLHSTLGYRTPAEALTDHQRRAAA